MSGWTYCPECERRAVPPNETTCRHCGAVQPPSEPPPDLLAEAQGYIARSTWTFATTMADNPHWYTVRGRPRDRGWFALDRLIRRHGEDRRWHGFGPYRALDLDGWSFWAIEPVVNTKPVIYAGWDGGPAVPAAWLPGDWHRDLAPGDMDRLAVLLDGTARGWVSESDHWGVDPDEGVEP